MPRKPANLLYGVDDKPPLYVCLVLAVQHVFFLAGGLIVVTMIMHQLNYPQPLIKDVIAMSMVAGGIATILQALNRGPVGSGYLCAEGTDPSFIAISVQAGAAGGLPLVFGMTMLSGLIECGLAKIMHRLRVLFPPDVTGVVLVMVGLNIAPLMIRDFFGVVAASDPVLLTPFIVAMITLCSMVAVNIWGKGKLRLYSVIVGLIAGYASAIILGVLGPADLQAIAATPFFSFPDVAHIGWSFDAGLLVPIIVVTVASTLKSVATLTMCQKINDPDWKRPDLRNIGRGTMADGIASILGGLCGAMGKSLYASTVGLSVATGVTSRVVAFYTGGLYIMLAFLPKISAVFSVMPRPVMGGSLVFMVSFIVISGIQLLSSRMIDIRRTFVIAVALMFGLSVDIYPALYSGLHPWVQPFVSSSLTLTTVLAVGLNLIFRLGVVKTLTLTLRAGTDASDTIFRAVEQQGGAWGARREVMYSAMAALNEFMEAAALLELPDPNIEVAMTFDELSLAVRVRYRGPALPEAVERPTREELRRDPAAPVRLAAFMLQHHADRVTSSVAGDSTELQLHFVH